MEPADQNAEKAKQIAADIFAKYDADNSGTIDKEEAKQIFVDILKKHRVEKINVTDEMLE